MALFRKIKEKLSKIISKKKVVKAPLDKTDQEKKKEKEVLGRQQMVIEQAKYYTPPTPQPQRVMPQELPSEYNQDKIVLQVRDPWWIHAYWEITASTWDRLKNEFKDDFYRAKRLLRVYDISHIIFNGTNAHRFFDIQINDHANNWYIDTAGPGRSWCVDLGLFLPNDKFVTIARSNTVHTPLECPSWVTDEEWMIPEDMFARLYGMGFGLGQSSPVGKAWQERVRKELFSGILASPGISSVASPGKKVPPEKKFWLVVDCELIVYGATEPDAKVTVQGKPIPLRKDGTFTLRFALPEGRQVIPVKAISSDNEEERTITPIVTRTAK